MKKKIGKYGFGAILTVVLLLTMVPKSIAQKGVEIHVSNNEVEVGETVEVTYAFSDVSVGGFKAPIFKGFDVSGPMTSSQVNIINGSVSRSKSVSFVLLALKPGNYSFDGAEVTIDGKKVKTAGFSIQVKGNGNNASSNSSNSSNASNGRKWQDDIFIVAAIDKNSAYVGEQIVLEYQLWTRLEYIPEEIIKNPVYNGFLMEDIKVPNGTSGTRKEINGVPYQVIPLKKVALFGSRPGKKVIPPLTLRGTVFIQLEEDMFPGMLFNKTEPKVVDLSTKEISIDIKALPEAPPDFLGGVGKFELFSIYDRTNLPAGEALHLRLKIEGSGNIKLLQTPELQTPNDLEVFEPKVLENINNSGAQIQGFKDYDWVIVPQEEGDFKIPAFSISFFDPEKGVYYRKEIDEHPLTIRGKALQPYSPPLIQKLKGKLQSKNQDRLNTPSSPYRTWMYAAGGSLFILSLLLISVLTYKKRLKPALQDNQAPQEAIFKLAQQLADSGNEKEALSALLIELKKINTQNAGIDSNLSQLMSDCEQSIYSPLPAIKAADAIKKGQEITKDLLLSIHQIKEKEC